MRTIHVVPSFHYDVAYLKPYAGYLPDCFAILDEALRLLDKHPEWRFLVEQTILLEEYWERFPDRRDALRRFAREGRLGVAPGQYVMPDMNLPDGESLFLQARVGKAWLAEHLGVDPAVCWIADCWGHPPQVPQVMRQCGYEFYAFWRCMSRDVRATDFAWRGLDGTAIRAHWLARGYANLRFPASGEVVNALELDLTGCGPADVRALADDLARYGDGGGQVLVCNGGDMAYPQATGPAVVGRLDGDPAVGAAVRFSTPEEALRAVAAALPDPPTFAGEFNSSLQGTFTSNVRLKQLDRRSTNRLLSLESLSAVVGGPAGGDELWKPVLKQQFHDILCGTITDAALADALREYADAGAAIDARLAALDEPGGAAAFNPTSFPRTEVLDHGARRVRVDLPPFGFAALDAGRPLAPAADLPTLPLRWENEFYAAEVAPDGFLRSLVGKSDGLEHVAADGPCRFGAVTMQIDYGDLWLNFASPLDGGSAESALTQNDPDPFDRKVPGGIVNDVTIRPRVASAAVVEMSDGEVVIEQRGELKFWRLAVGFVTRVRLSAHSPRVEYETTIRPSGKHYRLRAAFPTPFGGDGGATRHEVQFGSVARGPGEHACQNWIARAGPDGRGLAALNAGTPGAGADGGVVMVTLFRSAAMEYKCDSAASFNEGVEHVFRYAVAGHRADDVAATVREGLAFNRPPLAVRAGAARLGPSAWSVDAPNVIVSALRPHPSGGAFVRLYECAGRATRATLGVPGDYATVTPADGLERPAGTARPCAGGVAIDFRPHEIVNLLLEH